MFSFKFFLFIFSQIIQSTYSNNKICIDEGLKIFNITNNSNTTNNENIFISCAEYYRSEGWHIINIKSIDSNFYSNNLQSYSAGYLEGFIYHKLIDYHYINIFKSIFYSIPLNDKTNNFIYTQLEYVKSLFELFKAKDDLIFKFFMSREEIEYYETLGLILEQYKGLYDGYKYASLHSQNNNFLTEEEFYLLTMQSDLEDIILSFETERVEKNLFHKEKDCSGFVKFVKEDNNLIVAHNTHNLYTLMNRIYKNYDLNLILTTGKKLNNYKYSSRPGDLNSKDDYYVLDNKMVVLETSLEIVNKEIYENLKIETIPKWIRVNIANKLGGNNIEWIDNFFKYNSGTHNNQWLIIDYKEFDKYINNNKKLVNKDLTPQNIIHIVEQTPLIHRKYYEDVSVKLINDSYFASYNAPYFKEVIETIGFPFDYWHARRYFLFKELNQTVNDVDTMKIIIRFHNKDDICDTIAPRCDTIGEQRPFGSVDGKVIDINMIDEMNSHIIYGPPNIEGMTLPFNFTKYIRDEDSHLGIPDYFDFKWIVA